MLWKFLHRTRKLLPAAFEIFGAGVALARFVRIRLWPFRHVLVVGEAVEGNLVDIGWRFAFLGIDRSFLVGHFGASQWPSLLRVNRSFALSVRQTVFSLTRGSADIGLRIASQILL